MKFLIRQLSKQLRADSMIAKACLVESLEFRRIIAFMPKLASAQGSLLQPPREALGTSKLTFWR